MGDVTRDGPPGLKPIVVFGTGPMARVVHHMFSHDSPREVVAFTVDGSHLTSAMFLGLPVVAFDETVRAYPP